MIRSILDGLSWALGFGLDAELDTLRQARYAAQRECFEARRVGDTRRLHEAHAQRTRATTALLRFEIAQAAKRSRAKPFQPLKGSRA